MASAIHELATGTPVPPPSLKPPPTSLPLPHPQAVTGMGFGTLHHASNSPWLPVLRMVIYTLQGYTQIIPPSPHTMSKVFF